MISPGRGHDRICWKAVFVRILLFVLFTVVGFPLVGVLTGGLAFLTVAATLIGPLRIGAIIGGVLA